MMSVQYKKYFFIIRIRISFIARFVCTYEEFVLVTVAPQCDKMTATGQDTDNKKTIVQIYEMDNMQNSTNTIYKIDNSVCTGMLSANLKCNKYVC